MSIKNTPVTNRILDDVFDVEELDMIFISVDISY